MSRKHLIREPQRLRGTANESPGWWWYEQNGGIHIVVERPGFETLAKTISWRYLREALARKDKP